MSPLFMSSRIAFALKLSKLKHCSLWVSPRKKCPTTLLRWTISSNKLSYCFIIKLTEERDIPYTVKIFVFSLYPLFSALYSSRIMCFGEVNKQCLTHIWSSSVSRHFFFHSSSINLSKIKSSVKHLKPVMLNRTKYTCKHKYYKKSKLLQVRKWEKEIFCNSQKGRKFLENVLDSLVIQSFCYYSLNSDNFSC